MTEAKFFIKDSILYKRCHDSCGHITTCIPFGKSHIGRNRLNGKMIDWYNCEKCKTSFITKNQEESLCDADSFRRGNCGYENFKGDLTPIKTKTQECLADSK